MEKKYEQYDHHGKTVWVDPALKGKHREMCLCWDCKLFIPSDRDKNCPIASKLFNICVEYNLTTPVTECPQFMEKES
jgi:hypothetical protein